MLNEREEICRKTWVFASKKFKFELITPYSFEIDGELFTEFAFLPEYGSQNGALVILHEFSLQSQVKPKIREWIKRNHVFMSQMHYEDFLVFNEEFFLDILEDWKLG